MLWCYHVLLYHHIMLWCYDVMMWRYHVPSCTRRYCALSLFTTRYSTIKFTGSQRGTSTVNKHNSRTLTFEHSSIGALEDLNFLTFLGIDLMKEPNRFSWYGDIVRVTWSLERKTDVHVPRRQKPRSSALRKQKKRVKWRGGEVSGDSVWRTEIILCRGPTPQRIGWTVTGPSLAGRLHSLGFC